MFLTSTVKESSFSMTESISELYEFILESQEAIADNKFEIIALEHESLLKKEQGYLSESEFLEAEEEVKEKGKGFLGKIVEFISGLISKIKTFVANAFTKFRGLFMKKQEVQVPDGLMEKVSKIVAGAKAYVEEAVKGKETALASVLAIMAAAGAYTGYKKMKGQSAYDSLVKPILEVGEFAASKLEQVKSWAAAAEKAGNAADASKWQKAASAIAKVISALARGASWATAKCKAVGAATSDAAGAVKDKVVDIKADSKAKKDEKESGQKDMLNG